LTAELILFYTDGVTDATDAQGQSFGLERLQRLLVVHGSKPANDILVALESAINGFAGSTAQFDDIAILIAKRL
jgi:sigma-B regulation protein RsbU (phosphoserine phosphatase)